MRMCDTLTNVVHYYHSVKLPLCDISCGIHSFPPQIHSNAFGVLKWKRKGEEVLEASGIPYTVCTHCV